MITLYSNFRAWRVLLLSGLGSSRVAALGATLELSGFPSTPSARCVEALSGDAVAMATRLATARCPRAARRSALRVGGMPSRLCERRVRAPRPRVQFDRLAVRDARGADRRWCQGRRARSCATARSSEAPRPF